jgi:formylglycine-generating enzyme required for sulfatase activity
VTTLDLGDGVPLALASIPAGEFEMGSTQAESSQPVHRVQVPAFWCGIHEVTREQWRQAAKLPAVNFALGEPVGRWPDDAERERRLPVNLVPYRLALEFCKRLSRAFDLTFRLPTEAEWEYACRAGSTTNSHYGDQFDPALSEIAVRTIPEVYGVPVMSRGDPNRFGLWHMIGNASEWCADAYFPNHEGAPVDGTAREAAPNVLDVERVMRGGSSTTREELGMSWWRSAWPESITTSRFGFRVVCTGLQCAAAPAADGNGGNNVNSGVLTIREATPRGPSRGGI